MAAAEVQFDTFTITCSKILFFLKKQATFLYLRKKKNNLLLTLNYLALPYYIQL